MSDSFTYTTTSQQSNLPRRDYFAGLAMGGFISGVSFCPGDLKDPVTGEMIQEVVQLSVLFADAMIKELEK